MNLVNQFDLKANLKIEIFDVKTKELLREINKKNLVTSSGRDIVRDLLNEVTDTGLTHIAIGTDSTAVVTGDTALGVEVYRNSITKRQSSPQSLILSLYVPSTAANGSTITEAGIFNAASAGNLFARAVHAGIAKTSSIALFYTWTINVGAS